LRCCSTTFPSFIEVDENLDEGLTDASDTDDEDEAGVASQEEDGDGDDDEETSIPKSVSSGSTFVLPV